MTAQPLGAGAGFGWALGRDIRLGLRSIAEILVVLGFFFVVATLFPIGVGPDPRVLSRIGAGIIWVCATLACLLSLARMFAADYADGTLEQMLFSAAPFEAIVAGKVAAHWITTGCPLLLCAPLVGLQFGLGAGEIGVLLLSLVLGTPVLSLIGAIMAGLTLGLRGGGALLALLLLYKVTAAGEPALSVPPFTVIVALWVVPLLRVIDDGLTETLPMPVGRTPFASAPPSMLSATVPPK